MLVRDAICALWRRAPALAEVATHALGARDASNQVTTAVRKVYMHHRRIRPKFCAPSCNLRTDACNGKAVCPG